MNIICSIWVILDDGDLDDFSRGMVITFKAAVLFSGGKDSCYAIWFAVCQGMEIITLITVKSKNPDSFMFHTPNIKWTKLQAVRCQGKR